MNFLFGHLHTYSMEEQQETDSKMKSKIEKYIQKITKLKHSDTQNYSINLIFFNVDHSVLINGSH